MPRARTGIRVRGNGPVHHDFGLGLLGSGLGSGVVHLDVCCDGIPDQEPIFLVREILQGGRVRCM